MARALTSKVITANALLEGDAIWFTQTNEWTRDIAQAELITDEAHGDLRLLEAMADQSVVAGVYLADAKAAHPITPTANKRPEEYVYLQ